MEGGGGGAEGCLARQDQGWGWEEHESTEAGKGQITRPLNLTLKLRGTSGGF